MQGFVGLDRESKPLSVERYLFQFKQLFYENNHNQMCTTVSRDVLFM